uniref:DNA2/NAM7 helicase helicase domain-containing protein n=2 Tax=Lutzomyia longipalpis TaxID=7200 RepID=A0A1B0CT62_LUTLO
MDEGAGSSKSGGYGSPRGKRTQRSPPSPSMNPSGGAIQKARQESPSPEKSMAVPGSPQVIVEDAALLPEPHLITALKNSTEHLIMIGDPTQISFGKTTFPNHLPGTTYFERTIEKGYAVKLNIQYRMHPDIAELVRDVFFNDLVDGDDVRNILPISGIGRNLFCVTTTIEPIEVANRELLGLCANNFAYYKIAYATKENVATLLFISKLVLYLFNHGYTKNDIVILTSDDAHEDAVERCMSIFTIYKNVQVKSINHFAGKECRLGIVCLLRNENEKEIGFPEEEGILSSLLTRAREGLIIVENLSTMPEENQVWKRVSSKLREMQAIATYFPARCEVHGAEMKMVTYLDFEIFINEGCKPGEVPLEGHKMCGEDDENLKEKKEMSPSNVKENSGKIDHQKDVQSDGAAGDVPTHPANASGSAEAPQDSASQNNVRPLRISKYASRKFSLNELEGILALDTFSAFLSIMSDVLKFENTVLEDGKSHEAIIMLILILGKLHKVPLRHHLKELTNRIFGHNATFRNDIMIYDVQSDGAAGDALTHPENASGSAEAPQDSASQNNVRPLRISKYASRKFSLNELEGILALDTFSAFLSIMSDVLKFENTVLEDGKSHETIIMLILILGKLHKVPLRHHLKELTNRIFGHNATFRNDIMIYVKYAANLEEHNEPNPLPRADQVWASLETFCRYAKRFQESKNCWISCTRGLCRILDGKTHRTLVKMRVKLTKLLEKLENNYFYKGTLYASVQDMKRKPEYVLPKITNGKFEGIGDFLEYHILHGRAFFLGHLLDGLQGYRELDEEQKNGVLLKDVNGSNIFPCVRIFPHYPPFMEMGKKLFLMDLAPNKRTFGRLPKDVREEVTEEKLRLGNMVPLFLSTSSEFNDIIVAVVPHVPERAREQGFVIIDIVYMENVKESIFNKDLFLLTIPCKFVTKYFTLEFLEKISSATFPMKEFFIDCEESTNIAGNVDFTAELANDASLQLMDQEQLKALEMGLKKRLTIIHGPPGTGKTAVAVKIAECLLVDPSTRILLVSHKNWVLDRMTLKFSSLTDEIVRIGTFIHDPEIEKFTLSPIETDLKYGRVKSNAYNQCVSAKKDFVDAMESFKVRGEEAAEDVRETLRIHREAIDKFDQIYRMWMYFGCQDKRILAMTTTATAKYHDLVELLCPTVAIQGVSISSVRRYLQLLVWGSRASEAVVQDHPQEPLVVLA